MAALAGFLLSNYYFAPPIHTFTIADTRDILALVMFLVTAGVVSVLVDLSARRTAAAIQARTDAQTLARVAGRMVAPEGNPLPALLEELQTAFRLDAAAVLRRQPEGGDGAPPEAEGSEARRDGTARGWSTVVSAGGRPPKTPDDATLVLPLTGQEILALRGPGLTAEDREILSAFAAQLASALQNDRLHAEAAEADSLARANQLRSALLAAVSHDLRTPLASIKAASSSLLSEELEFGPEETEVLLQTIDDETDRLNSLVENLLDMSRLQTGSVEVLDQSTDVGDLVGAAVASLGPRGDQVTVDLESPLPRIHTDPVLLERAVANLVDNALIHGGSQRDPHRSRPGGRTGGHPGHRSGAGDPTRGPRPGLPSLPPPRGLRNRNGVGLGLAVARGFVEAVGGQLDVEDTPGGGATMVVRLPAATPECGRST